jgi:hypothetical protein
VGRFWNSKQSDIKHKARNIKKWTCARHYTVP